MLETTEKTVEELNLNSGFTNLIMEANRINSVSVDTMLERPFEQAHYFADRNVLRFLDVMSCEWKELSLTHFAFSQLCTKIGVPTKFADKCIDTGRPYLSQDIVNDFLEDYRGSLFVRQYENTIRGILTSKYSVLDSHEILTDLGLITDSMSNYSIKGSYLSPERLHLRAVSSEPLNIPNEDLFAGFSVDSSDVGRSTLIIRFFIYKQVCTNGLMLPQIGGNLFSQKHIGISRQDFRLNLQDSLSLIPELVKKSEELISENSSKSFNLRNLDFEEAIKSIQNRTKLSEQSAKKVVELAIDKYRDSKWGLVNAITEVAQDFTLERRLELETVASDYLFKDAI